MEIRAIDFSKKEKKTIIFAVTLGNLLEWYELYLYVYWSPLIAHLFFKPGPDSKNLINAFLVFGIGFLARPLGGLFFGRLGDKIGRRKSLIISFIVMILPSIFTAFLPTYKQVGFLAPCLLITMRFLQSFPAGGELPGAFCYLYESSESTSRRYMCSWGAVGYQLGILISTIECFFLKKYLSEEALLSWGWRLSFLVGGLIGFVGLCLRYKLHETPLYQEMVSHHEIVKNSIMKVLSKYKKGILLGILFCALNSASFYILSISFPISFSQLGQELSSNLIITIILLILVTIPLPYLGKLADRVNNKKMLIGSTLGIIALLYPMYLCLYYGSLLYMTITIILFSFFFTILSALIPFILCDLFPTQVRFTCVGVSFNIADATIGGFTPAIVLCLIQLTGNIASSLWFLLFCGILSLISYILMRSKKPLKSL